MQPCRGHGAENLDEAANRHSIHPSWLRCLRIVRPDHVWASDITYTPMKHGFLHLTAVVDRFSRDILP